MRNTDCTINQIFGQHASSFYNIIDKECVCISTVIYKFSIFFKPDYAKRNGL